MIIGQSVFYIATGEYFSPPFGRGGEQATFGVDVQHVAGGTIAMTLAVEHKNADDTAWTTAGTFGSITAAGTTTLNISGLKEQIRFKYSFTAGASGEFMHIVMLAPVWQTY